jgi:hypothetical protein
MVMFMFLSTFSEGPNVRIGYETVWKKPSACKWQKRGEEFAHAGNESSFGQPIVNQRKYLRDAKFIFIQSIQVGQPSEKFNIFPSLIFCCLLDIICKATFNTK